MRSEPSRAAGTRAQVEGLLRDGSLSMAEIARRLGLAATTVKNWNRAAGIRRSLPSGEGPRRWPAARRRAVARLLCEAENDPRDIAEAVGLRRKAAAGLFTTLGVERPERDADAAAEDPARLRARLRRHIARQIAQFDAVLDQGPAGLDSARVLRDLGGLKRLLDDLGLEPGSRGMRGEGEADDQPDLSGAALAGLRAEIARRYERFVGLGAPE